MDRVLFFLVRLDWEESFALVREKALEDLMVFFLPKLTRLAHCWSVVKVFFLMTSLLRMSSSVPLLDWQETYDRTVSETKLEICSK